MALVRSRVSEEGQEEIDEALAPPNQVNPDTGLPYGWTEESELAGLDSLLTG